MKRNIVLPPAYRIMAGTFRAADAERITGLTQARIRDLRRHGLLESPDAGWADYTAWDLSRMLLLACCMNGGMKRSEILEITTTPQVLGAIVKEAALLPGAVIDETHSAILKKDPSILTAAAFELAGMRATATNILIWSGDAPAQIYAKVEDAWNERKFKAVVNHIVDLHEIAEVLVSRAGEIARLIDFGEN